MPSLVNAKNKAGLPLVRLSPNEEARLLKEEREKRRKLRLLQVREQAKANAARIRQAVKTEKSKQIQILAEQVKEEWEQEKAEKLHKLQELYERSLKSVGEGHQGAMLIEQEAMQERKVALMQEDFRRAEERYKTAMKKLKKDQEEKELEANRHIMNRQIALGVERSRSAMIASLPPPAPDPIMSMELPKVKPVKLTDMNAFSTTHYHLNEDYAVEKATPEEQVDAKGSATEEEERIQEVINEKKRVIHERQEKARLRHKHALDKELLKQEYNQILHDLSDLQRADIQRRQKVIAKIPRQVFQAPHRRLEEKEEEQFGMERAFENLYMAATDRQGDLSLALDPHPAPATPEHTDSLDLSVTASEGVVTPVKPLPAEKIRRPMGGHVPQPKKVEKVPSQRQEDSTLHSEVKQPAVKTGVVPKSGVFAERPKLPETSLRRLYDRIKAQRDNWTTRTSQEGPETDLPEVDEAPRHLPEGQQHKVPIPQIPMPQSHVTLHTQVPLTGVAASAQSAYPYIATSTDPSPSQYTITSSELSSEQSSRQSAGTLTTGRLGPGFGSSDMEEGPITPSQGSTITSLDSQEAHLKGRQRMNTGPLQASLSGVIGSDTLLHPMEEAARIRQQPSIPAGAELGAFLAQERKKQEALKKQSDAAHQQAELDKRKLELQRDELQKKILQIESQRTLLESQLAEASSAESKLSSPRDPLVFSHPNLPPLMSQNLPPEPAQIGLQLSLPESEHQSVSSSFMERMEMEGMGQTVPKMGYQGGPFAGSDAHQLGNITAPGVILGPGSTGLITHESVQPSLSAVSEDVSESRITQSEEVDLDMEEKGGGPVITSVVGSISSGSSSRSASNVGDKPAEILKIRSYQQDLLKRYRDKQEQLEESRLDLNKKAAVLMKKYVPEFQALEPDNTSNDYTGLGVDQTQMVKPSSPAYQEVPQSSRIVDIGQDLYQHADTLIEKYAPEYGFAKESTQSGDSVQKTQDRLTEFEQPHISHEPLLPVQDDKEYSQNKKNEMYTSRTIEGHVSFHEPKPSSPPDMQYLESKINENQSAVDVASTNIKLKQLASETAQQKALFEKQQSLLRQQLLEIRQQKQEILDRQKQQEDESISLRRKWAEELEKYRVKDDIEESSIEDRTDLQDQSDNAGQAVETERDARWSATPGQRSWLHAQAKPPTKQLQSVMHVPHELSAIEEMDTPLSLRMTSSGSGKESLRSKATELSGIHEEHAIGLETSEEESSFQVPQLPDEITAPPVIEYHGPKIPPQGQDLSDSGIQTRPQTFGDLHQALYQAREELERAKQLKNSLGKALQDMQQKAKEEMVRDLESDFIHSPTRPEVVGHEQDNNDVEPEEEFHPSFEGITVSHTPKRPSVPGQSSVNPKYQSSQPILSGLSEGSLYTDSSYYSPPDSGRQIQKPLTSDEGGNVIDPKSSTVSDTPGDLSTQSYEKFQHVQYDAKVPQELHKDTFVPLQPEDTTLHVGHPENPAQEINSSTWHQELARLAGRPSDSEKHENNKRGSQDFPSGNVQHPSSSVTAAKPHSSDRMEFFNFPHDVSSIEYGLEAMRETLSRPISSTPARNVARVDVNDQFTALKPDSFLESGNSHSESLEATSQRGLQIGLRLEDLSSAPIMSPNQSRTTDHEFHPGGQSVKTGFSDISQYPLEPSIASNSVIPSGVQQQEVTSWYPLDEEASLRSDPKRLSGKSYTAELSQYPIQDELSWEGVAVPESQRFLSSNLLNSSKEKESVQDIDNVKKLGVSAHSDISQTMLYSKINQHSNPSQKGVSLKSFGSGASKLTFNSQTSDWTEETSSPQIQSQSQDVEKPHRESDPSPRNQQIIQDSPLEFSKFQMRETSLQSEVPSQYSISRDAELSTGTLGSRLSGSSFGQQTISSNDDSVFMKTALGSNTGNVVSTGSSLTSVTDLSQYPLESSCETPGFRKMANLPFVHETQLQITNQTGIQEGHDKSQKSSHASHFGMESVSYGMLDSGRTMLGESEDRRDSNRAFVSQYPIESSEETLTEGYRYHIQPNQASVPQYLSEETVYEKSGHLKSTQASLSHYPSQSSAPTPSDLSARLHIEMPGAGPQYIETGDGPVFRDSQSAITELSQYPLESMESLHIQDASGSNDKLTPVSGSSGYGMQPRPSQNDVLTQRLRSYMAELSQYPIEHCSDTSVGSPFINPGNLSAPYGGQPQSPAWNLIHGRMQQTRGKEQFKALQEESWQHTPSQTAPVHRIQRQNEQTSLLAKRPEISQLRNENSNINRTAQNFSPPAQTWNTASDNQQAAMDIDTRIQDSLRRYEDMMNDRLRLSGAVTADEQRILASPDRRLTLSMLAEQQTGISDEPELSLVSVGSEKASPGRSAYDASCEDQHSRSLVSFEQHEKSLLTSAEGYLENTTPNRKSPHQKLETRAVSFQSQEKAPGGAVSFDIAADQHWASDKEGQGGELYSIPVQHVEEETDSSDSYTGLSLQEALEKKRNDFIHASQLRQKEAKVKAKKLTGHGPLSKTLASWKQSRGLKRTKKSGAGASASDRGSEKIITKTSGDRKSVEKEMKERTSRLYNQLDEVQHKKVELDRKKEYEKNREKAKDYNKKYQDRLKKKTGSKQ